MAEFTKAYCDLHPHQLITNFCIKQQCLVGLCANCICTHTQCHVEKGTSPHYENIRTTCKKMQESLQIQIEQFDQSKERIINLCGKVQEKRKKLNELVDTAKQEAISAIQSYFEERRNKMLRQIQVQEKQAGLHCENRLEALLSSISRESSALIYAIDDINSANFIQSLPRIRTQTLANAKKFHNQICYEIQQNQNFNTCINFHKSSLQRISSIAEELITISFSLHGKQTFIKAESNQLQSSRASSNKDLDGGTKNLNNNPSITFRLQENGMKKQNVQSQINFGSQRYGKSLERREREDSQQKFYQKYQQPAPMHYQNNHLNQTQQPFRYPNFLSEVPRNTDFVVPLGISNAGGFRTPQQKISMSRGYQGPENTAIYQLSAQESVNTEKTSNLGKKSRKSGLRVLQTHESETEYSRDQNGNSKKMLSRGSLL